MTWDLTLWNNGGVENALSREEELAVKLKLWKLLERQTKLFTAGDSSSVPVETAQELLTSISFTIDQYLLASGKPTRLLVTADLEELFAAGLKVVKLETEVGLQLWRAACVSAPEIWNESYRATLRSIGTFFNRYDYRFMAHLIPCDIDYQLCRPVPENTRGILYINEYLRRIGIENAVLGLIDSRRAARLLERCCPGYRGLLINLCLPVLTNAVGLELTGGDPLSLEITQRNLDCLTEMFSQLSAEELRALLMETAEHFCTEYKIADSGGYMALTVSELCPRIRAALPGRNLDGVFIPLG